MSRIYTGKQRFPLATRNVKGYLGTHAAVDHASNLMGRENAEGVLLKVHDGDVTLVGETTETLEGELALSLEGDIVAGDVDGVLGDKVEHLATVLVVVVGEDTGDLADVGSREVESGHACV